MPGPESPERIADFAQMLLERAKVRKGAIAGPEMDTLEMESDESEAKELPITLPKLIVPLKEIQASNTDFVDDNNSNTIPEGIEMDEYVSVESGKGERRSRLKSLTKRINEWEDDMTHYVPPASRFNVSPPKSSPRFHRSSTQFHISQTTTNLASPTKQSSNATSSPKEVRFQLVDPFKSFSPQKTSGTQCQNTKASEIRETPNQVCVLSEPSVQNIIAPSQPKPKPTVTMSMATSHPIIKQNVPNFSVPTSGLPKKWEVKGSRVELNTTLAGSSSLSVAERAKLFEQKSQGNIPIPKPFETVFEASKTKVVPPAAIIPGAVACITAKPRRSSMTIPHGKVQSSRRLFEAAGLSTPGRLDEDEEAMDEKDERTCTSNTEMQTAIHAQGITNTFGRGDQDEDDNATPCSTSSCSQQTESDESISFSALNSLETTIVETNLSRGSQSRRRRRSSKSRSRSSSPQKCIPIQSTTPKRAASPSFRRSPSPDKKYAGACDVKRIKVNEPKPGNIYPSLTDIEATTEEETEAETEAEGDIDSQDADTSNATFCEEEEVSPGSSLGSQIQRMAKANVVSDADPSSPIHLERFDNIGKTPRRPHYRPTEEFSASLVCHQIDAMIDSALDGQSFSMDTIMEDASPLESSSPLYPRERDGYTASATPLLHSVSFFRKQEQQMCVTPKKTAGATVSAGIIGTDEPELLETPGLESDILRTESINEQIKKLDDELEAQVKSIAQVSKALNLCKSTIEFSDSTENVECEKVLLFACQKRNAILNEMTRLRTEGVLSQKPCFSASRNDLGPSCRGNLTISGIAVELKEAFIRNKVTNGDNVYHFLVLLKEKHRVEMSSLVSIGSGKNNAKVLDSNNCLHFPNTFRLEKLEPDFKAELEVFVLQTQREFLPHETKYHIKKKESKVTTPRKLKAESKLSRAVPMSPAGPDAVRSPNFVICGRLTVNISTLATRGRIRTLDGVRLDSPVEGSVSFQLQCSAEGGEEMTGFLTLFDDISGFGAWHRRWSRLSTNHISFWMYPEDEQDGKFPVDEISLRNVVTTRVSPVHRDVCARSNTLLLVTTREADESDKNSLIVSCHGNRTAIRHLLSADTREERDAWCAHLNRALANSRAWDPHAASPDDSFF